MKKCSKHLLLYLLLATGALLCYCRSGINMESTAQQSPWLNHNDTVAYVGAETCKNCHAGIYETFMRTGMGQSFYHATPQKSAARFGPHIAVYDSINRFYYHPFWRSDSLFILEYRLLGKDTAYRREQYIKYIIGSGQHTNSHLFEENGYLYQAPVTFYSQKGIWDLAPGFEGGFSSRFNRIIGQECMTCHNSLPQFNQNSENKFDQVPMGITCERCHGPGQLHVQQKLLGNIVDTATQTDYTIVNPRKLPTRELQMNVCQRCHLQGVSVLKAGKSFSDFKPGMNLTDIMDVFLPEFDGNQTRFIMASQAHRLTKSACYQNSNMTCLSCHNPHISVKETPRQTFNNACLKCHTTAGKSVCTMSEAKRINANKNDCSGCHMQVSGSIDIPHVTIHDHFIRKPISETDKNRVENFIGLVAATGGNPAAITRAKGYLHYFESYTASPPLLDSAQHYLQLANNPPDEKLPVLIHALYLKQDFWGISKRAAALPPAQITDAWTAYRIGEAFLQNNTPDKAQPYFEKACRLLPLQPDFGAKLGICLLQQNRFDEARKVLLEVLKEHKNHVSALTNLGFIEVNTGNLQQAEQYYRQALRQNPGYEQALMNMAGLRLLQRNTAEAKKLLTQLLAQNPHNKEAKLLMQQLIK
ncbi:pilus assembly protein TadD [Sphingobacteriales bacterium UPWRP_1]|nr:hypothetical protein B6N25_04115 [Sphingobacteriales bacterium TSM_CSS]PSJ73928.1 pilus assembly protein TadD [Sphingobacteriales bacterium UPWRP_1]